MEQTESTIKQATDLLNRAIVFYRGKPVGTVAALDTGSEALNYDQVFVRDFAVSAVVFLLNGQTEIVKNFLEILIGVQSREKQLDCFKAGQGLMPASFKVITEDGEEKIIADFGEKAIARVTPIDSSFWWLYLLRCYVKATDDRSFTEQPEVQNAIRLILDLCLTARFDMFPTLLVPDGSFMIDRRMGVYGYPLEIQVLFYMGLMTAREFLISNDKNEIYLKAAEERLGHLLFHVREFYWIDIKRLNEIYSYDVEEFGKNVENKFNIYPQTIPDWVNEWAVDNSGYFAGNLGPARLDFRFFTAGNLLTVLSSFAEPGQTVRLMNLIEAQWDKLIGAMPAKLCYPAVEGEHWKTITGADPKNTPWSYHNGGNWTYLLWLLSVASIKTDRLYLIENAVKIAEENLPKYDWCEYFDGEDGSIIGKEARKYQTWTIAGYLAAKKLIDDPARVSLFSFDEDKKIKACELPY